MSPEISQKQPSAILVLGYAVAGLCLVAVPFQLVEAGPVRNAALLSGAALLLIALVTRFAATERVPHVSPSTSLLIASALGIGGVIYGLSQLTPSGPVRQFLLLSGTGVAILVLAWRLLPHGTAGRSLFGREGETQQERDARWTGKALLVFCYVGAGGMTLYGLQHVLPSAPVAALFQVLGAGTLIACCALLTGALFGFLFGIPRAQPITVAVEEGNGNGNGNEPSKPAPAFQVNTNLEQISDWLTKIVVGLGLVNLASFPGRIKALAAYFAVSLGNVDGRESVVLALLVLFTTCGFLLGYLLTRLYLTGAFTRAQEIPAKQLQRVLRDIGKESATTDSLPNDVQIASIQKIDRAASKVPRDLVKKQVLDLAKEYEVTRASMPFSQERTRRLDGVVLRMQGLALQAYEMLPTLTASSSEGDRLAAVAFLQMRPDEQQLSWLTQRFSSETPFVKYHAALALRQAVDGLGASASDALFRALNEAIEHAPSGDSATRTTLDEALEALHSRRVST